MSNLTEQIQKLEQDNAELSIIVCLAIDLAFELHNLLTANPNPVFEPLVNELLCTLHGEHEGSQA